MDIPNISEIAKAGMNFERTRLEVASLKIAQANVAYSTASQAKEAANKLGAMNVFDNLIPGSLIAGFGQNTGSQAIKVVNNPDHPMADTSGQVYFVDVDPVTEMATLVTALRNYQANVRAYNTNSEFNRAALEIGGNR